MPRIISLAESIQLVNTYDTVGNRLSMEEANGTTHSYEYDAKYQLTDWLRKDGKGKKEYHFRYSYDAVGNREELKKQTFGSDNPKTDDWWDHPVERYTYNEANQLMEIKPGLGEGDPKKTSWYVEFGYDKNGNQISKIDQYGTTAYEYDYENMIKHISFPDTSENEYRNCTCGTKRPAKTDSAGFSKYFYDDYQGIEHILLEYDEDGNLKARYTLGPRVDEIISKTTQEATTCYHCDGLGSVTSLTDEQGNLIGEYEYTPFGKMLAQPEGADNRFTFTGREYDIDSGLYYYRARHMDAKVGRFISKDPAVYRSAISPYIYVKNNPVRWVDPHGLYELAYTEIYQKKVATYLEYIDILWECVVAEEDCETGECITARWRMLGTPIHERHKISEITWERGEKFGWPWAVWLLLCADPLTPWLCPEPRFMEWTEPEEVAAEYFSSQLIYETDECNCDRIGLWRTQQEYVYTADLIIEETEWEYTGRELPYIKS